MDDIRSKGKEYRKLVARRSIAHIKSSEWHRHRGVQLGVLATLFSTIVSTTIFVTITRQLGLGQELDPTFQGGLLYVFIIILLILAPVLSALQTYLKHPEQAEKHKASCASYYRLQQRLDLFLLRYANVNSVDIRRDEALKELEDISKEIETVSENSITLTDRAYVDADEELLKQATE